MLKEIILISFVLSCLGCKLVKRELSPPCPSNDVIDSRGIFQYTFKKLSHSDLYWFKDSRFLDLDSGIDYQFLAEGGSFKDAELAIVNKIEKERNIKHQVLGVRGDSLFIDWVMMREILAQKKILRNDIHAGGELYDVLADSTLLTIAYYMEMTSFLIKDDCEGHINFYNGVMSLPICPVPANRLTLPLLVLIYHDSSRKLSQEEIDMLGLKPSKIKTFYKRDCSG